MSLRHVVSAKLATSSIRVNTFKSVIYNRCFVSHVYKKAMPLSRLRIYWVHHKNILHILRKGRYQQITTRISHWQQSIMPQPHDSNPGSGERQLAVSGNALDHSAIRAGPVFQALYDHTHIHAQTYIHTHTHPILF